MLRHLKRLLLCVVLGLVTTVVVAWGCAWVDAKSGTKATGQAGLDGLNGFLFVSHYERPGATSTFVVPVWNEHGDMLLAGITRLQDLKTSWATPVRLATSGKPRPDHVIVDTRGWPFASVWCEYLIANPKVGAVRGGLRLPWLPLPDRPFLIISNPGAFPYLPIWSGLLIDTAAYGGAWWLLLFGVNTARLVLRRRRGGCPKCGYSLSGLPAGSPCPECGAAAGSAG